MLRMPGSRLPKHTNALEIYLECFEFARYCRIVYADNAHRETRPTYVQEELTALGIANRFGLQQHKIGDLAHARRTLVDGGEIFVAHEIREGFGIGALWNIYFVHDHDKTFHPGVINALSMDRSAANRVAKAQCWRELSMRSKA